jgi:SPP1 gp7 family putative phage head morphogenesis protein
MYEYYRKDDSIFPKPQTTENSSFASFPPKAVLDLADKRAIEWLQNHDITFLSKFITDADTIKRVTDFINKFYLEQGEAIGDNEKVLNEFIKAFSEVLDLERWKIRRILDTSVNKVRSYANVNYMSQANVAEFKVVEVMDRITCPHCKAMNNRVFSVSITKDKIEKVVKSEMTEIGTLSPFATSIPIVDLEKMTDKELQAKGIDATPFHPSCRGTLVAVL